MSFDKLLSAIGGTQTAHEYMEGVVPGTEHARNIDRNVKAACAYMRGAGVRDAMAEAEPELYATAVFQIAADWSENPGQSAEGTKSPLSIAARQIILQLRHDKRNKEEERDNESQQDEKHGICCHRLDRKSGCKLAR